ncbi:MAG: hypothetical protein ABR974_07690 [Bacteroidales bacterium]|jgi:hypothetical protein
MEKKKLQPELQIVELFMVKPGNDYSRTFVGQIYRETTKNGKPVLHGSVTVNEGRIWSSAQTQDELGKYLDDICTLKLDGNLHSQAGVTTQIFGEDFFLN